MITKTAFQRNFVSVASMWSNEDLNANTDCLVSTGDPTLDKLISQWISWDKVSVISDS